MRLAPNRPLCHVFLVPMAENEVKQGFEDPLTLIGKCRGYGSTKYFVGETRQRTIASLVPPRRHLGATSALPWSHLARSPPHPPSLESLAKRQRASMG